MRIRTLLISTVAIAALVSSAQAEPPPIFLLKWGVYGFGASQFNGPWGVAADGSSNVIVADAGNDRAQRFNEAGQWLNFFHPPSVSDVPRGVAFTPQGDLLMTDFIDTFNFAIDGTPLPFTVSPSGGGLGLAVDAAGFIYIASGATNRIRKFGGGGGATIRQWGGAGSGPGQFSTVSAVAADLNGHLFATDLFNHRVQKFTTDGLYLGEWGGFGSADGQFNAPYGIAVDVAGNVYVTDAGNHNVQKFTGDGQFLSRWGSFGSGDGQLNQPVGVAVDLDGNVFVAEFGNNRVSKFGLAPVAARPSSWGRIKALYR